MAWHASLAPVTLSPHLKHWPTESNNTINITSNTETGCYYIAGHYKGATVVNSTILEINYWLYYDQT